MFSVRVPASLCSVQDPNPFSESKGMAKTAKARAVDTEPVAEPLVARSKASKLYKFLYWKRLNKKSGLSRQNWHKEAGKEAQAQARKPIELMQPGR